MAIYQPWFNNLSHWSDMKSKVLIYHHTLILYFVYIINLISFVEEKSTLDPNKNRFAHAEMQLKYQN
jgi:hypothetical protein